MLFDCSLHSFVSELVHVLYGEIKLATVFSFFVFFFLVCFVFLLMKANQKKNCVMLLHPKSSTEKFPSS